MAWIDVVFIAIIILFAIIGLVKGLFDSILSLIASVASVFLAFWASKPVAEFINKLADVNKFFEKFLVNNLGVTEEASKVSELASVCTLVLSMIIVFVLIKVAVWLLAKLFDSATANSTALSGMNRLLGLAFGAVKGFAIVLVVLCATAILGSNVDKIGTKVDDFLDDSKITLKTYNYVVEWVDDSLSDKLDDFVKELAEVSPKNEDSEPVTNYAELTKENTTEATFKDTAQVTDNSITITLISEKVEDGNVTIKFVYQLQLQKVISDTELGTNIASPINGNTWVNSGLEANTTYRVTMTIAYSVELAAGNQSATETIVFDLTTSETASV